MIKVQIAAPAGVFTNLLSWLQDVEIIHVMPIDQNQKPLDTTTSYLIAQLQFALELIGRLKVETDTVPKRSFKNIFARKPTATLAELNKTLDNLDLEQLATTVKDAAGQLSKNKADQQSVVEQLAQVEPWLDLPVTGEQLRGTTSTAHNLIKVNIAAQTVLLGKLADIPTATWQEVGRAVTKKQGRIYYELLVSTVEQSLLEKALQDTSAEKVELHIPEQITIKEQATMLRQQLEELKTEHDTIVASCQGIIAREVDVKLAYDGLLHLQEREHAHGASATNALSHVLAGWIPAASLQSFTATLSKHFPTAALEAIEPEDAEEPPVAFKNSALITPFEAVTDIFGKPKYHELDPTPALSLFFLVSFGLALTDAGYGIVMMIGMFTAERFFKLKKPLRKMVRLLFYAGIATTVLGALTGGWFGLVLEELPPGLLVNLLLQIKVIDPLSSPISLLMVAFAIGITQLLFAWVVKGYDFWRKGEKFAAIFDAGAWVTMVLSVLMWVGAGQEILPAAVEPFALWLMIGNALVLVATQGRQNKNPLLRLGAGFLSLYGLVAFLSDVLSYSRLLALGLATGIIGLVVNLIGGMVIEMVPVIGIVLAVIILIGGHTFNLGINTLGAFIHAGRLQFVEFFPKFMEGGGTPYRPLGRVSKYVDNPNDF